MKLDDNISRLDTISHKLRHRQTGYLTLRACLTINDLGCGAPESYILPIIFVKNALLSASRDGLNLILNIFASTRLYKSHLT